MHNRFINIKNVIQKISVYCFIKCFSLFKISCIVGSRMAFFSGASIIIPLVGICGGLMTMVTTTMLSVFVRGIVFGFNPFLLAVHHIPGLCGALYWINKNRFMRTVVPLLCMFFFIIHPVGNSASLYTLYWMIPVILQFVTKRTMFFDALGSTFTAHAVGSVLWLYGDPMTPAIWLALIPVVFIERIVCATGMVLAYQLFLYLKHNYHTIREIGKNGIDFVYNKGVQLSTVQFSINLFQK